MRSHWTRRGVVLCALLVVLAAGGSYAAGTMLAREDRNAPKVSAPRTGAFTVGAQVQPAVMADGAYLDVPITLRWTAEDPSQICSYSVEGTHSNYGSGFPLWQVDDRLLRPRLQTTISDYDETFGSVGGYLDGFVVTAYDCRYNSTSIVAMRGTPTVFQEHGQTTHGIAPPVGGISYTGTWGNGHCDCAAGGGTRWTTEEGATVRIDLRFQAGDHLGLVMSEGKQRGSVSVLLDGEPVEVVDTHDADRNRHRVVVLDLEMPGGRHVVEVVNEATAGHPRVTFDAVAVS